MIPLGQPTSQNQDNSEQRASSIKGHTSNILDFVGQRLSSQLCPCRTKAAKNNTETNGQGHLPIKLYLQKQAAGQTLSLGHSSSTPDLEQRP